jgi:hemerythrin superfamily protein
MARTEEDTDLIDVIIKDHREFEAAFVEIESHTGHAEGRKDLVDHAIAEIIRHEVAEEQFVYPATRSRLPDGDKVADHEIEEHAKAEEIMKDLEGLGPESPHFEQLVKQLIEDVRHHMSEEEENLLPRLKEACDRDELQDLGHKVMAAKEFAPTRPHPNAPDTPPANLILGPGIGFIDKIRDTLSRRKV